MATVENEDISAGGGNARPRVQSVARATAILLEVAKASEGRTAREISDALGLSRPTTYHLIQTLVSQGFLTAGTGRRLLLGLRVGTLAEGFHRQLMPPENLMPHLRELAASTGESASVAGWRNGEIVVVASVRGTHPIGVSEIATGLAGDGHARAAGKLLLAHAPDAARERYLREHPLRAVTPATITDLEALEREFEAIRERGYATDADEYIHGVGCIAAPLDGGVSYAVELSAPSDRFSENLDHYRDQLLRVAKEASRIA